MKDLAAVQADWLTTQRESRAQKQAQELAALAKDEAKLRTRMAKLDRDKPQDHDAWLKYQLALLKIMELRAKLEGTAEPVRVEQKVEAVGPLRVEYVSDWLSSDTKTITLDAVTPEHVDPVR